MLTLNSSRGKLQLMRFFLLCHKPTKLNIKRQVTQLELEIRIFMGTPSTGPEGFELNTINMYSWEP